MVGGRSARVMLVRLRCNGPESELRVYRGRYASADEVPEAEVDMGPLPAHGDWWDVPLPPCPDCGGAITWFEAQYVPGARKCTRCGSMFSVEVRHPMERSALRKVDFDAGGQAIYRVPETTHWADWADPDAIAFHGVLVARRTADGAWLDAGGRPAAREVRERFEAMESAGLSKKRKVADG